MIYVTLLSLMLLLFIHFFMFKVDWLSPTIIVIVTFLISTSLLAINANDWGVDLASKTFFTLIIGIFAFSQGEIFARSILKRKSKAKPIKIKGQKKAIKPSNKFTNLVILYMLVVVIWYFLSIRSIVLTSGFINSTFLGAYRASDVSINSILKLCLIINLPIAYCFILAFIENYFYLKVKIKKYLVPVLLYFISLVLSSGRMEILFMFVSIVAISYMVYYQEHGWNMKFDYKMTRKIFLAGLLSLIVFYILGYLTGKSNVHSFYYTVSLYIASPIAALDYFLSNFEYSFNNFGNETLIGLNNLFQIVGIELNFANERILEFAHIGNMPTRTNIYTSFRRVINDYGYLGMLFYQYIIGFSTSLLYQKVKLNDLKNSKFTMLLYAYIFRYLLFQFVDERILMNLITLTAIVQITVFWILLKYLSKYKKITKKRERVV